VVLGSAEAQLAKLLDGRRVSEALAELSAQHVSLPLGGVLDVCVRLSASRMLEDSERVHAGLTGSAPGRDGGRWLNLTLKTWPPLPHSRVPAPVAGWLPWAAALGVAACAGCLVLLLPPVEGVMAPGGSAIHGLVLGVLTASLAASARQATHAVMARWAGVPGAPLRAGFVLGIPAFDPGAGALAAAHRKVRVIAALGGVGVPLLVACALAAGCRWGGAPGAIAWSVHILVGWGLLEACPVGTTACGLLFSAALERRGHGARGLEYLQRRFALRLLSSRFAEGERLLLTWVCVAVAWCVVVLQWALSLVAHNGGALAAASARGGMTEAAAALALGVLCVGGAVGVSAVVLVGGFWALRPVAPRVTPRRAAVAAPAAGTDARTVLARVPLLARAPGEVLDDLAAAAESVAFGRGELLVRQGEAGDAFYVLVTGTVIVEVEDERGARRTVATLGPADGFGEVALLEDRPRSASVRGRESGTALRLPRDRFAALSGAGKDHVTRLVRGAGALHASPLFRDVEPAALGSLLESVNLRSLANGEAVFARGAPGDGLYVTVDGEVEVLGDDDATLVARLGRGEAFGEIALVADAPRSATVRASGPATVLFLPRAAFLDFVGRRLDVGARVAAMGAERLARRSA